MIRYVLISLFFLLSCNPGMQSKKVSINDQEMLYGQISEKQLFFDYPDWQEAERKYNPKDDVVKKIDENKNDIKIITFLGTWCGDSRRNVPRFLKAISGNPNLKVEFWAVDRKKKLDNGLTEKYAIKRVPTFIFFKNDREVGRITEHPQKTIEEDILDIINTI